MWNEGVDLERSSSGVLSADGNVVYATRACNGTTSQRGRQWVQLWPAPGAITGCETDQDGGGAPVALPNSSSIMLASDRPGPSLVRILRP